MPSGSSVPFAARKRRRPLAPTTLLTVGLLAIAAAAVIVSLHLWHLSSDFNAGSFLGRLPLQLPGILPVLYGAAGLLACLVLRAIIQLVELVVSERAANHCDGKPMFSEAAQAGVDADSSVTAPAVLHESSYALPEATQPTDAVSVDIAAPLRAEFAPSPLAGLQNASPRDSRFRTRAHFSGVKRRASDYSGPFRRATDRPPTEGYAGPLRRASDRQASEQRGDTTLVPDIDRRMQDRRASALTGSASTDCEARLHRSVDADAVPLIANPLAEDRRSEARPLALHPSIAREPGSRAAEPGLPVSIATGTRQRL